MKHRVSNSILIASLGALLCCACSEGGDGPEENEAPQALINEATAQDISAVVSTLGILATTSDLFMVVAHPLPSLTETFFCPGGGAVEYGFVIDAEPTGELSAGDRILVDYQFCREDSGLVDGTLGFDFLQVSGQVAEGNDYDLELDLGLDSFITEVPDVRVRVHGLVPTRVTGDLSGSFLTQSGWTLTTHTKGNVTIDESMLEFLITCDIDNLPGGSRVRTVTLQAVLENEVLPGELLTVETIVPFVAFDGQNPYVGELKVVAGDDSAMRIVVVDTEYLELYLDKNGDGLTDEIIQVPWASM